MGALLPEGNGQYPSWQNDSCQVYRTCRDFYKKGLFIAPLQLDQLRIDSCFLPLIQNINPSRYGGGAFHPPPLTKTINALNFAK